MILRLYLYLANPTAAHREIIADEEINSQPIICLILSYFCFLLFSPFLNNLSPAFDTLLHPLGKNTLVLSDLGFTYTLLFLIKSSPLSPLIGPITLCSAHRGSHQEGGSLIPFSPTSPLSSSCLFISIYLYMAPLLPCLPGHLEKYFLLLLKASLHLPNLPACPFIRRLVGLGGVGWVGLVASEN